MKYTLNSLAEIVAQIVQFSMDNYGGEDSIYPEDVKDNCAYITSCFVYQHTTADAGIAADEAATALKIGEFIPYADRVELARKWIAEHSVVIDTPKTTPYKINDLPNILAQIVDFSMSASLGEGYTEEVQYGCAYICSCFVAQHCPRGNWGVESEESIKYLEIGEFIESHAARVKLARMFVKDYS